MHRKPTAASTTDYFVSNHPMEQKIAACRYMWHRKYDLLFNRRKTEKKAAVIDMAKITYIPAHLLYEQHNKIRIKKNSM